MSRTPTARTGRTGPSKEPGKERPEILRGRWVTSYSGWMHFDPLPKRETGLTEADFQGRVAKLPPLFPGSRWIPPTPTHAEDLGSYEAREGYFAFAAWACYDFAGDG